MAARKTTRRKVTATSAGAKASSPRSASRSPRSSGVRRPGMSAVLSVAKKEQRVTVQKSKAEVTEEIMTRPSTPIPLIQASVNPPSQPSTPSRSPRRKRDPETPPRPPNAWILYRTDRLKELQRTDTVTGDSFLDRIRSIRSHPHGRITTSARQPRGKASPPSAGKLAEISKLVSMMWKGESNNVRVHYAKMAQERKIQHRIEYPDYKYRPRRKEQEDGGLFASEKDEGDREAGATFADEQTSEEAAAADGRGLQAVFVHGSSTDDAAEGASQANIQKQVNNQGPRKATRRKAGSVDDRIQMTIKKPQRAGAKRRTAQSAQTTSTKSRKVIKVDEQTERQLVPDQCDGPWYFRPFDPFMPPMHAANVVDEQMSSTSFALSPAPSFHFASPHHQQHQQQEHHHAHAMSMHAQMRHMQHQEGVPHMSIYTDMSFGPPCAAMPNPQQPPPPPPPRDSAMVTEPMHGDNFQPAFFPDVAFIPATGESATAQNEEVWIQQDQTQFESYRWLAADSRAPPDMISAGQQQFNVVDVVHAQSYDVDMNGMGCAMDTQSEVHPTSTFKPPRDTLRIITNNNPADSLSSSDTCATANHKYNYHEPLFTPGLRLNFYPLSSETVEGHVAITDPIAASIYCPSATSEQSSTLDCSSPLVTTPEDSFQFPAFYGMADEAGNHIEIASM